MNRKRKTVSVSDLANFCADESNFLRYKTHKNPIAIKKGLEAHGEFYKAPFYPKLILLSILILFLAGLLISS